MRKAENASAVESNSREAKVVPADHEEKLSTAILKMIAGNLDRWKPHCDQ